MTLQEIKKCVGQNNLPLFQRLYDSLNMFNESDETKAWQTILEYKYLIQYLKLDIDWDLVKKQANGIAKRESKKIWKCRKENQA